MTPIPEIRHTTFEIKELNEQGRVIGLSSVYRNRDRGGDVVVPGAFAKTLSENGGRFPLFYGHKINIGVSTSEDSPEGLLTEGHLNLEKQIARDVYSDLKFYKANNMDFGMSIGYGSFPDRTEVKNGTRYLKEVVLFENTLTELPMNPLARTLAIKSMQGIADAGAGLMDEIKAGRRFSAATRARFEEIMAEIRALLEESESTPESEDSGAAKALPIEEPPEPSAEPDALHSELSAALENWRQRLSAQ